MDEKRFQNSTIQNFYEIKEYLPILLEGEVAIGFTTLNNYLFAKSTDFCPMDETLEAELPESIRQMIQGGEVYIGEYSEDVQTPFKSYTIPVRGENGKVEGAILLARSLEKKREVQNAFETIKASLEQITLAISDLNVNIQEVVETNGAILNIVREANEKTADTNGILNFIQEVSSQTNLLGLNAAIEAARAGEYGRGFDVVAKEIRKLSSSTTDSIKKVDTVLNNISDSIKTINEKVGESNGVFEVQASSLEEIAASIEELNSSTQIISGFIDKL